jgi:hypothetical protein
MVRTANDKVSDCLERQRKAVRLDRFACAQHGLVANGVREPV